MRKTHNSSDLDIDINDIEKYKMVIAESRTPVAGSMNDKFHANFHSSHSKFVFENPQRRSPRSNVKPLHEPKNINREHPCADMEQI
jgi:hypothetical protein